MIRSFSRGKTIDTSNSNNLKQFIFGTEKIKENRKKYEDALKDFTDTIFNYNQNLNTIKILTDKEKALSTLYGHLKTGKSPNRNTVRKKFWTSANKRPN